MSYKFEWGVCLVQELTRTTRAQHRQKNQNKLEKVVSRYSRHQPETVTST